MRRASILFALVATVCVFGVMASWIDGKDRSETSTSGPRPGLDRSQEATFMATLGSPDRIDRTSDRIDDELGGTPAHLESLLLTLTVTVLDDHGQAAIGVPVHAHRSRRSKGRGVMPCSGSLAQGLTDEAGETQLLLPDGAVMLNANCGSGARPDYGFFERYVGGRTIAAGHYEMRVERRDARLRVQVTGRGGDPVPLVQIGISGPGGLVRGDTGEEGEILVHVVPGPYEVQLHASPIPQLSYAWPQGDHAGRSVTAVAGDEALVRFSLVRKGELSIDLEPEVEVRGMIKLEIQSSDPVYDDGATRWVGRRTTHWVLAPGSYTVSAAIQDENVILWGEAPAYVASDGETHLTLPMSTATHVLSGQVVDEQGYPVPNAPIRVSMLEDDLARRGMSQPDGTFAVHGLPDLPLRLTVAAEKIRSGNFGPLGTLDEPGLIVDAPQADLVVRVPVGFTIRGTVYDAETMLPVGADVLVSMIGEEEGIARSTRTGLGDSPAGSYAFHNLRPDEYRVWAGPYWVETGDYTRIVVFLPGATSTVAETDLWRDFKMD